MQIQSVFLLIADISGYTRFVTGHKFAPIHAEKIVIDLLKSVIGTSESPLQVYEIMGDAVSFYAIGSDPDEEAQAILSQVRSFIEAFKRRESELISECRVCSCEACRNVEQLKLKVIMHFGEAVASQIQGRTKLAGESIILAHRLLKNSIDSDEYILLTDDLYRLLERADGFVRSVEQDKDLGEVVVWSQVFDVPIPASPKGFMHKVRGKIGLESYVLRRMLKKPVREFRNLPD
jgi:hypothetical protein